MSSIPLSIRLATLDDAGEITRVHCSDISKWFKYRGGAKIESRYEELSVEERFRHGGPWMSIETCAIHLNYILLAKQYPIVVEYGGRIVGELELYIGEEKGRLGKTAFIDILEVHKDYRRRGVGRALISEARGIAVENKCSCLSVWPDKGAIPFYNKCGLNNIAYEISHIIIDVGGVNAEGPKCIEDFPEKYHILREMFLISPRIYSSLAAWLKSRWFYALRLEETRWVEGYIPSLGLAFRVEEIWSEEGEARVFLWLKDVNMVRESIYYLCGIARDTGFRDLHLFVEKELASRYILGEFPSKVVGEEIILTERLRY